MRLDDHMMTVLTGLVFAIVLGAMAQNSDAVFNVFSQDTEMQVEDDVFFVRAGTASDLDILANDYSSQPLNSGHVKITRPATCGSVSAGQDGITFANSDACSGVVTFAYCVDVGGACESADVLLNVREAPRAVADAFLPSKGDLVPLPLQHVVKSAPNSSAIGASLEDTVKINAFVVTFVRTPANDANGTAAGEGLAKFLVDTSTLDLIRAPIRELRKPEALHTIEVPLSAARTARFLHDYSAAEPTEQKVASVDEMPIMEVAPELPEVEAADQIPPLPLTDGLTDAARFALQDPSEPEIAAPEMAFEPALSLTPRADDILALDIEDTSAQDVAPLPIDATEQANACAIDGAILPDPGAHMRLVLTAPCQPHAAVRVVHAGLTFAFDLDADGRLVTELPMLEIDPQVTVTIAEIAPIELNVLSNDVEHVKRSVIVHHADTGLRLAAMEFDVNTRKDRITTASNSISHRDAYKTGRGYIRTYYGENDRQIEVYTLPVTRRVAGGLVKLNLIEGLGSAECANRATVDYLHLGTGQLRFQTAEVTIPDCAASYALGDVIGNIRIAAR